MFCRCVFASLTTAMRYEPANARFFAQEICSASLADSLRLLGCFSAEIETLDSPSRQTENTDYLSIFDCSINDLPPKAPMTQSESACLLMRLLYDMALDISDKCSQFPNTSQQFIPPKTQNMLSVSSKRPNQLLSPNSTETPLVVHPCIMITMLQLIPSLPDHNLRIYLTEKLRSLLKLERNQQVMCEFGLISEIMSNGYQDVLLNENMALYASLQYILERLSAQHIHPKELR